MKKLLILLNILIVPTFYMIYSYAGTKQHESYDPALYIQQLCIQCDVDSSGRAKVGYGARVPLTDQRFNYIYQTDHNQAGWDLYSVSNPGYELTVLEGELSQEWFCKRVSTQSTDLTYHSCIELLSSIHSGQ